MRAFAGLMELPILQRSVVVGTIGLGVFGGIAGLVIGLLAYPPTAWFALFELGIPAAIVGAVAGLIVGSAVLGVRRLADACRDPRRPADRDERAV